MVENKNNGYLVKVLQKELVAAALPMHDQRLPLSNLDLLVPPVDVGIYFCYRPTTKTMAFIDMVSSLKTSLAKVLVTYYPFAGELDINSAGEPELFCNNRGVDFLEAFADIELGDLCLYNPDETVEGKLVPKKMKGVLCVQATELRCGGLVLSCSFDHRVADAHSANMFLVAWADTARSKPISTVPSFTRSLLSPRFPLCDHDPLLSHLFMPLPTENPPPTPEAEESVNRIYYIKADDIERIQKDACSFGGQRRSKLEAFTAYLWRITAKGARESTGARACSMGIVVDGRSRLDSMGNYFGNVLSIPYATIETDELEEMEVEVVAELVHDCVRGAATAEHFQGLVDWVEARRPEPALARVYCGPGNGVGDVAVVVSSGRQFPVGEVEFGWGKAVFGSYHFRWGDGAGYVMPMPSMGGKGDWVVYLHIKSWLVEAIEAEAGDVFRRITPEYVMLDSTTGDS